MTWSNVYVRTASESRLRINCGSCAQVMITLLQHTHRSLPHVRPPSLCLCSVAAPFKFSKPDFSCRAVAHHISLCAHYAQYEDKEWDWLRGALATVDRSYGVLKYFHHVRHLSHQCLYS